MTVITALIVLVVCLPGDICAYFGKLFFIVEKVFFLECRPLGSVKCKLFLKNCMKNLQRMC